MNIYGKLAKLSVFSVDDVTKLTGNKKTAYSALDRMMKRDQVRKIRQNVYSCVNQASGQVFASRYQIACAVSPGAYISHHTAFEFYGLANQVFFEVYISSDAKFRDFEFNNVLYRHVSSKLGEGVIEAKNTSGVRVTDLERTVVDGIKDFEKIGGFEELIKSLEEVLYLDEVKLKKYLDGYDIKALYQKTGYLLDNFKDNMQLTDEFIRYCQDRIGKSTRYLLKNTADKSRYDSRWQLVVPEGLFLVTKQDGDALA